MQEIKYILLEPGTICQTSYFIIKVLAEFPLSFFYKKKKKLRFSGLPLAFIEDSFKIEQGNTFHDQGTFLCMKILIFV